MGTSPIPWSPYRPVPPLALGEVHVARLSLEAGATFIPALSETLSQDERQRASAFQFERDRERYVSVRGALRVMLARYLGTRPAAIRFRTNRFGKPLLVGSHGDGVRFNVSHSGSLALFAFACGGRVGVDTELVRDDLPYMDLASRFFSSAEQLSLRSRPAKEQVGHFFEVWTRKEAYVKGRGRGFTTSPNEFSVAVDDGPVDDEACSSRPGSWRTLGIDVAEGYAAAVAVEGIDCHLRYFEAVDALDHGR